MTRHRKPSASLPDIDVDMLRDHGDDERIDRVWERLERNLVVAPPPSVAPKPRRWPLLAAGIAAGFIGGAVSAGWFQPEKDALDGKVVVSGVSDEREREVFAAGTTRRSYVLPNGVQLELEPGSIVDTLRGKGNALRLRLVRGEAKLTTPDGNEHPLALRIGRAEVATAAGSMRVRLEGDMANLEMRRGSASISEPDVDDPSGRKRTIIGEGESRRVRVRVITASVTPRHVTPAPPHDDAEPNEDDSAEPSEDAVAVAPVAPSWVAACERGDYEGAVNILAGQPGGVPAVLGGVTSGAQLSCLATGYENVDLDMAKKLLDRVVKEHRDDPYAGTAASTLERLYRDEGDEAKADEYAEEKAVLSKGLLASAKTLCSRAIAAGGRGEAELARQVAQQYKEQFPGGDCSDSLDAMVAKLPPPPPAPPEGEDAYGEIEE